MQDHGGRPETEGDRPDEPRSEPGWRDDDRSLLGAILEASGDLVSTAAPSGRILYLNGAGRRMLGIGHDEPLDAWKIADLHPAHALHEMMMVAIPLAMERGRYRHETWIRRRDGTEIPVWQIVMSHRSASGEVEYLSTIMRDLSERRRAELLLHESEVKFRNIIQALPMGIHLYRLEPGGRLVFEGANPAADRLLGIDNQQFIGMRIENAFPPLAATEIPDRYRRAARDGAMWQTQQISYEHDAVRGAFEVFAFQTSPGRMAAAFVEITERLQSIEALRRSEERHRNLFETMAQGVLHLDDAGRIAESNPAATRILGSLAPELIGRVAFDPAWSPVDGQGAPLALEQEPTTRARTAGEPCQGLMGLTHLASGERRWVDVTAVPAMTSPKGGIPAVYVTLTDVTERVHAEQERIRLEAQFQHSQRMEAVGRLAGGVAHDFNNLLTAILGYSDMIRRRLPAGDPLAADVEQIERAGQRAAALTQQLLAFGRKQAIDPRPMDLNHQVLDAERMLGRLLGEDVHLKLQLDSSIGLVLADPNQIGQVLVNLAVNARDAMPHGGELRFETANVTLTPGHGERDADARPGDFVMLAVTDTGCGMDEATRRQAFEPFFTTKGIGRGTGLGLSTVYGIVRQNDGQIQLLSEPGAGTTVKIFLPRLPRSELPETINRPDAAPGGTETILIVEDEDIVRRFAVQVLTQLGYRVLQARDAESANAVCRAQEGRIDLLLSDVVLPGTDGRALSVTLRETHAEMRVLFMSGYSDITVAHHGVVGEFLPKPFSVVELATKVREVLASHQRQAAGDTA